MVLRVAVRENLWLRLLAVGAQLKASQALALEPVLPHLITLAKERALLSSPGLRAGAADKETVYSQFMV